MHKKCDIQINNLDEELNISKSPENPKFIEYDFSFRVDRIIKRMERNEIEGIKMKLNELEKRLLRLEKKHKED